MISNSLKIFLLIITLIYFIFVLKAVKQQKMPIKSSILWLVFGIIMIICIFIEPLLKQICNFIGIENVSNFLLFGGFMALLILSFDLYKLNYELKRKIVILGQELAVIKNENKKNNK